MQIIPPSLPKGGGAIKGMGEAFQAREFTGAASLSIPIPASACRGFEPKLSLDYGSGSGNGVFGIGWSMSIPSIVRRTSKEIPRYNEHDTFIFTGGDDLVRIGVSVLAIREGYEISDYRPRTEGLFSRIEHWVARDGDDSHWRVISPDNVTSIYGASPDTKIVDPANPHRIFQWLLQEVHDDKGNRVVYEYESDANRYPGDANRYLARILYGNPVPGNGEGFSPENDREKWCFRILFTYAEPGGQPVRLDPFSSYKSGFEIRTRRLCHTIEMFHCFHRESGFDKPLKVGAMQFEYDPQPTVTYLRSVTHIGFAPNQVGQAMPPLVFGYSRSGLSFDGVNATVPGFKALTAFPGESPDAFHAPPGRLDDRNYRWVDLYGEGLPGILYTDGGTVRYWPPKGDGQFAPSGPLARFPIENEYRGAAYSIQDLAGDGKMDLVVATPARSGYYESQLDGNWAPFRDFEATPSELFNSDRQMIDVTGDGRPDLLFFEPATTDESNVTVYASQGKRGYEPARRKIANPPLPVTCNPSPREAVRFANMFGDGGSHLVRISAGSVECWPNLGHGRFGPKVEMANAPAFEGELNPERLFLADIDGSGLTDILYAYPDRIEIYRNECGNRFGAAVRVPLPHAWNDISQIQFADVLGNGTTCLVLTTLKDDLSLDHQYCDLTGGRKPHLLTSIDNNLGATTRIDYAASTKFYLADQKAGTPWLTRLPFPVHVVERIETRDHFSRSTLVASYGYHHGFFDGIEREFRGFGRVDRIDAASFDPQSMPSPAGTEFQVPPVLTKTWYHTGVSPDVADLEKGYDAEYYKGDSEAPTLRGNLGCRSDCPDTYRALHGHVLREEVYAKDSPDPYAVTQSSFGIRELQIPLPAGGVRMIPFSHPYEALQCEYDRNPADPRIHRNVTLEVDDFGHVLKALTVAYGRRSKTAELSESHDGLQAGDGAIQRRTLATYTESSLTNAINTSAACLSPQSSTRTDYELAGLPLDLLAEAPVEMIKIIATAAEVVIDPLENGSAPPAAPMTKRLLGRERIYYRKNDLTGMLPLGELESLALPFASYQLAFPSDPAASAGIPSSLTTSAALKTEGGYVQLENDPGWWIPSERIYYSPRATDHPTEASEREYAHRHFFLPHRQCDPFGAETVVKYDPYDLHVVELVDPYENRVAAKIDYRVLAPYHITDPNGNCTEVAFDALGRVAGTAVMGKAASSLPEGDSLQGLQVDLSRDAVDRFYADPRGQAPDIIKNASTRILYDLDRFRRSRAANPQDPTRWLPSYTATIARETHVHADPAPEAPAFQLGFLYSDGFGREIQQKAQAEPGPLPHANDSTDSPAGGAGLTLPSSAAVPRWVGTGWTIFNNKDNPTRRYEPFFSGSHHFEADRRVGVSSVLFYDPMDRVVATLHPDHTWEKTVHTPWRQEAWDANDTLALVPREDPDVAAFFQYLPDDEYLPGWLAKNQAGTAAAQAAALQASAHAGTPTVSYTDPLGRPFLVVTHNRLPPAGPASPQPADEFSCTRTVLDIAGRQLRLIDAHDRVALRSTYDMPGRCLTQTSIDAGASSTFPDIAGQPLYARTSRGHVFRHTYDRLRRPVAVFLRESVAAPAEKQVMLMIYGDTAPTLADREAKNLRGRVHLLYDQAGIVAHEEYDFKGKLLRATRRLACDYRETLDWSRPPEVATEPTDYSSRSSYDALNRIVEHVTCDHDGADGNVVRYRYNEGGFVHQVEAVVRGATTVFVTATAHNAKGQTTRIDYGNGASTCNEYDPLTGRLACLCTRRDTGAFPGDDPTPPESGRSGRFLQNLFYAYDAVGNIVRIQDAAQPTIYFAQQQVEPVAEYTYDALYRLIEATGREHLGQAGAQPVPFGPEDDSRCLAGPVWAPTDGKAMGNYRERYTYDKAGNLLELAHRGTNPSHPGWTRAYAYLAGSNRLDFTRVDGTVERYAHDEHGNLTSMPHLSSLVWDHHDQLRATARQQVSGEATPETTWYVYDAAGQRVRQVTESQAAGAAPVRKKERLYLGGFDIYREFDPAEGTPTKEVETLHVTDGGRKIALVETRTLDDSKRPSQFIRYQFDNHLGSCALELDESARIVSYEEYSPYGSTTYQAVRTDTETKRYRYSGKERDDATGFYYYGLRYYMPWLGRWINPDPAGTVDGANLYSFVRCNPARFVDPDGLTSSSPRKRQRLGNAPQATAPTLMTGIIVSAIPPAARASRKGKTTDVASTPAARAPVAPPPTTRKRARGGGKQKQIEDLGRRAGLGSAVAILGAEASHPIELLVKNEALLVKKVNPKVMGEHSPSAVSYNKASEAAGEEHKVAVSGRDHHKLVAQRKTTLTLADHRIPTFHFVVDGPRAGVMGAEAHSITTSLRAVTGVGEHAVLDFETLLDKTLEAYRGNVRYLTDHTPIRVNLHDKDSKLMIIHRSGGVHPYIAQAAFNIHLRFAVRHGIASHPEPMGR